MKKFLVGVLAIAASLGLIMGAWAAESDSVAVRVSILSSLGVDIGEAELNMGSVDAGSTTVSSAGVTVTNNGSGIPETYSLSLSDPSGWTASQTQAGLETYVLNAAFDADGSLTWDAADHALSATPVACSTTQFTGDQSGVSVPYDEARTLWFHFQAPTATTVATEQTITVTVTAQAA